jgi:excisionase family DNA binding protein
MSNGLTFGLESTGYGRLVSAFFMALPTFYTPSEVAGKLKVSRRSVYQWLTSGQLNGLKAGQSWRITEEGLIAFMKRSIDPGHKNGQTERDK